MRAENNNVRWRFELFAGFRCLALISALALLADSLAPVAMLRGASTPAQPEISPAGVETNPPVAGISIPAYNSPTAAAGIVPDDDALRLYLAQSQLVLDGEMMYENARSAGYEQFKVAYTIKGDPQTNLLVSDAGARQGQGPTAPNATRGRLVSDASNSQGIQYPDGEIVLFLYRHEARGTTNLEPFWRPRDATYGAMPATPALVAALRRLAAAQPPNSGADQLAGVMRKFIPDCTFRLLKYTVGNQTDSTAVLTGLATPLDRRQLKWVVGGSARAPKDIEFLTVMHCPQLTRDLLGVSNVQTARDAEDYVKLIVGLCAGPRALERWSFKATPLEDTWLVFLTYIGPPADVRAVGPMELVYRDRAAGRVLDLCEWRPNFKPGQTASVMHPDGMEPDGLDPAPADMDDPTLDYYLSRSEMVVAGAMVNDVTVGFANGRTISHLGDFKVAEAIKGNVVASSTISIEVAQRDMRPLKKDEELILFLGNHGARSRKGTEQAPIWETLWQTDDLDFGKLPSSPGLVAALKRLAAARGSALETPNLDRGEARDSSTLLDYPKPSAQTVIAPQPVGATGGEYEVDGEIVQDFFARDGSVDVEKRAKFTVFVKDCSWLIHTVILDGKGEPATQSETACTNGGEIYEIQTNVSKTLSDGSPNPGYLPGLASIVSNNVPVGQTLGYFNGHIWQMFASSCYFANLATNWITPVYDVNASAPLNPALRCEAKWKLINGPGSLPSSVVYVGRGVAA